MKIFLTILIGLFCLLAKAQDIQLHGKLMNPLSDTAYIWVWCEGELIDYQAILDPFYSMNLGAKPKYDILFLSGSREKRCDLFTANMVLESIQSDVDFRSKLSVLIWKEKLHAKYYTFTFYGAGYFRAAEYNIYETE